MPNVLVLLAAAALALTPASVARAQNSAVATVAVDTAHGSLRPPPLRASRKELFFGGVAGGAAAAFVGVSITTTRYWTLCPLRHRDDPADPFEFFDRCFFPSSESVAGSWLGAGFIGASSISAVVAVWRGCPKRSAILRSIAGAAVGSLPGVLAYRAGAHADRFSSGRSRVVAITPLIAGAGSSLAVAGCHR